MNLVLRLQDICFNPRALTSPDFNTAEGVFYFRGFNPRALTSPDRVRLFFANEHLCFNPRALTSPDGANSGELQHQPVSIHGLLRALTEALLGQRSIRSFNPRALTSPDRAFNNRWPRTKVSIHGLLRALTWPQHRPGRIYPFQSTGSYEP